ncbi:MULTISPECIES: ATP-binding protein [Actinomadura]|uniref:ATP-binding protein n=1 Tax=Actinomadura yumaensis TaxID=111807 RepID=A0ABW2CFF9_9ACTN|nr:ATP-binding protein [Actinomadura sp. J1-007]MWK35736.1 ATP-binding protein [Actinomadura sp. J1-007]
MSVREIAQVEEPLMWRRVFPGRVEQVRNVRQLVAVLLADEPCVDDVVLAASELFGNACAHTRSGEPGGLVVVDVRKGHGGAAIAVTDQGGATEPRCGQADGLGERGRGLLIVQATAAGWSWYGDQTARTVTAVFR